MGESRIELDVMRYIYGCITNIIQQYVGLSENWVYPQNSILFMGDVMVNQWIDTYPFFRQTHMPGVMMRYMLHVGMHLAFFVLDV